MNDSNGLNSLRGPGVHPLFAEYVRSETRRQFFRRGGNVLGAAALATLGLQSANNAIG